MQSGSGQVPLGLSNNIAGSGHLGPLACSEQPKRYDFHRRSLGAFRNKSNSFVQNFHRRKHGNDQNNAEQKAPPSLNLPDVDSLVPAALLDHRRKRPCLSDELRAPEPQHAAQLNDNLDNLDSDEARKEKAKAKK